MAEYLRKHETHEDYLDFIDEDATYKRKYVSVCSDTDEVHYDCLRDYVDFGLPSGTLWATELIGGNDDPMYFAWGETTGYREDEIGYTEGKKYFDWTNPNASECCGNCSDDVIKSGDVGSCCGDGMLAKGDLGCGEKSVGQQAYDYKYAMGSKNSLTKYCSNSNYGYDGFVDYKDTLDKMDDAAIKNWGREWRIPSLDQFVELFDYSERSVDQNSNSITLTSTVNGNTLTLPLTGFAYQGTISDYGDYLFMWTNYLTFDYSGFFAYIEASGLSSGLSDFYRCSGMPILPVKASKSNNTFTPFIPDEEEQKGGGGDLKKG